MEVSCQLQAPVALIPRKVPIEGERNESQCLSGRFGKRKKFLAPLLGIEYCIVSMFHVGILKDGLDRLRFWIKIFSSAIEITVTHSRLSKISVSERHFPCGPIKTVLGQRVLGRIGR
jgi:hypothetical protein